jgi:2-polyprenyl-3-methyl-5-hydroxy-6-metoxy-1,4-benzoquinol methylase
VRPHFDRTLGGAREAELSIDDPSGVVDDPVHDRFRLGRDTTANYMLFATGS